MRGLSVAEQGLCFIWDCFVKYQGTWAYLLLGALAVVLVLLYRKKKPLSFFYGIRWCFFLRYSIRF